jgi:His-Xaa-Ser system protein HxsD
MTEGVNIASDISGQFLLDQSLYSVESIHSTIYKFASDFFIDVSKVDDQYSINYKLKAESNFLTDEVSEFKSIFIERLIDEVLREKIREETADIRQLIITTTFSSLIDKTDNEHS